MPSNTANLVIAWPDNGDSGHGQIMIDAIARIDTLLGTKLVAGADPNVAPNITEGYQNAIITDANGVAWICTTSGTPPTGVWERLGDIVSIEIKDTRRVWEKGQAGTWRTETTAGGTISLTTDDDFVYVSMANAAQVAQVGGSPANDEAQIILMLVEQGATAFDLTWDLLFFKYPGGVQPPSPPANTKNWYMLVKEEDGNFWSVFPTLSYPLLP